MTGNVVVCGTGFGRVYLRALERAEPSLRLAGVLARGSARSVACAERSGVPLYTDPDDLPPEVDLAVVAVYAGVNGGAGTELAQRLMGRGIHVLQEGPVHQDELTGALRTARRAGVMYQVGTHYVEVEPVRRFIAVTRALADKQPLLHLDATCGLQVFYHLFDILRLALGGLRPWSFAESVPSAGGFATLVGEVHGVPVTLRVQNQLHLRDPDNHAHLLHRISVGASGGNLTLLNTHGPLIWSPRPHFPEQGQAGSRLDESPGEHLDYPSASPLGPAEAPSYRSIVGELWPAAAGRALAGLHRAARDGADPLPIGQPQLAVAGAWRDASRRLGPPESLDGPAPRPLSVKEVEVP
ncbi:Gfo/Idh/MocA family oxidoreductase [Verrucosispora sp. WMMA2121]|uniref:Gfo/Idh/MocA family oxidoreductase n=1 Tax=Verrucosispora sp. WMMA2121 TaxID=3015164 RepID=UPI0022B5F94E|nr:Gfo/Idh/MocA family oxidoreductase [Verrucosispora sp. WMMA2121]MCZ7421227.1 Gfo/Idh/MocA family oxidoreductase [Verrucosispora sp. WMMA2121]